ncbi:MAG TPA: nucleotidyltransferase family protein [Bryobacteraceae bacterium]|nr:nucleotidyltransferase family protein [Bryobacteraceae bacterium]
MATTEVSAAAIVDALRFHDASPDALLAVSRDQWPKLLDWCDGHQITFVLQSALGPLLPEFVCERMEPSRRRYSLRFARLEQELGTIIDILRRREIGFVLLKGMSHCPKLSPDPILRAQGDIDLWIPNGAVHDARRALNQIGYERRHVRSGSDRHLPPMALPSNWRWRGDVFDPEMPIRVELHHDLWRSDSEYIPVSGEDRFLTRLQVREIAGRPAPVLCPQDLLGFAALHLLLHLLHGDLPLQRAWEIARFLDTHARDAIFWSRWRELHSPELRVLQTVVFEILRAWFHCRTYEPAVLPNDVQLWLDRFAMSPLQAGSKDAVWLHLALIPSLRGRINVLLRRLLPVRGSRLSLDRASHHATTLLPSLVQGLRWRRLRRSKLYVEHTKLA